MWVNYSKSMKSKLAVESMKRDCTEFCEPMLWARRVFDFWPKAGFFAEARSGWNRPEMLFEAGCLFQ
jgi:hypothetical protein